MCAMFKGVRVADVPGGGGHLSRNASERDVSVC